MSNLLKIAAVGLTVCSFATARGEDIESVAQRLAPDSTFVQSIDSFGYSDERIEASWIAIVKETREEMCVSDYGDEEYHDENERGIAIIMKARDGGFFLDYYSRCLFSDDVYRTSYFPPENEIIVCGCTIMIVYGYMKYGWNQYTFSYIDGCLKLVRIDGVDANGPIIKAEYSADFINKTMKWSRITNEEEVYESNQEVAERYWTCEYKTDGYVELIPFADCEKWEEWKPWEIEGWELVSEEGREDGEDD